ncbi:Alkaline phosphatase [Geitlerinema sp. FC II]|nr:Alkaline phosphatase [Geitlerinema sp. FC II]
MDDVLNPVDEQVIDPTNEELEDELEDNDELEDGDELEDSDGDLDGSETPGGSGEFSFVVTDFVGNPAEATVSLKSVDGGVEISVEASQSVRGVFFNIADDSKLESLSSSSELKVKDDRKDVSQVGTASIAPNSYEVGVAGGDSVVVSGLTLDDLIGQEFGVRTQSDKLAGTAEEGMGSTPEDSGEEGEGDGSLVTDLDGELGDDAASDDMMPDDGEGDTLESVLVTNEVDFQAILSLNQQVRLSVETQSFFQLEFSGEAVDLDDLGENEVICSEGDDSVAGTADTDIVSGEAGNDELTGDAGSDVLVGADGNDSVDGGSDNDIVNGNTGEDVVSGGDGNDLMNGGQDNDVLMGGEGDDVIDGDLGDDILTGGGGSDTFVLDDETSLDAIMDFEVGVDRLAFQLTQSFTFEVGDFDGDGTLDLGVKLESGFQIATISGVEDSNAIDVVEVPESDALLA